MLGKTEGRQRRGQRQRMRWSGSIGDSVDMNLSKLQETVEDRGAWRAAVHGVAKSQARLSLNNTNKSSYWLSICPSYPLLLTPVLLWINEYRLLPLSSSNGLFLFCLVMLYVIRCIDLNHKVLWLLPPQPA